MQTTIISPEGDVIEVIPAPVLPLADAKAAKRDALASARWRHETGGIVVGGMQVATDRETQAIVDRIVKAFDDGDITGPVKFKRGAGDWVEIDEATARMVKSVGAQHVQACFAHECLIDGAIAAAANHAALDAIDIETGWP